MWMLRLKGLKKLEFFRLLLSFVVKVTKSVHAERDGLNFWQDEMEIYIWTRIFKIGYMQDVKYVFIVQKERSFIFN